MTLQTRAVNYQDGGNTMEGFVATDSAGGKRPAVMIAHAFAGQGEPERQKAVALARLGYTAFAIDLYGQGVRGTNVAESRALMAPFIEDRSRVVQGMNAALATVRSLDGVDASKIAAIGYCFGGLCVLDLARSGADVAGVVSFHGLFHPPPQPAVAIRAKILALHGWDDPMVPPESVVALGRELTAAGADWQVHAYGGTMHAFTNPNANDPDFGTVYHPVADRRSWAAMENFLSELFQT